jgi:hypothetical protein
MYTTQRTRPRKRSTRSPDKVLQRFFTECHKVGPDACAFYASSPEAISANLDKLYAQVLAQPVVAYSPDPTLSYGVVDPPTLKNAIYGALSAPYDLFSTLAQGLADLQRGNGSVLLQLSIPQANEAFTAISCGDGKAVTDDARALEEYTQRISNISSFESIDAGVRTLCSYVPSELRGKKFCSCSFCTFVSASGWRIHPDNFKGCFPLSHPLC